MRLAKIEGNGFDLIANENESATTFVRNVDQVKITYTDNGFIQLIKNDTASCNVGTLLIASGEFLLPTGDQKSAKTGSKACGCAHMPQEIYYFVILRS